MLLLNRRGEWKYTTGTDAEDFYLKDLALDIKFGM